MNPFDMPETDKDKDARHSALQNLVTITYDVDEEQLQRYRERQDRAGTGISNSYPVVTVSYAAGQTRNDQ
jgi:hypothetical protein